jgi:LPS-assembly protein
VAAIGVCLGGLGAVPAWAQSLPSVRPAPRPPAAASAPEAPPPFVELSADRATAKIDTSAEATGNVELRRADVTVTADQLHYDQQADRAHATGHVKLVRGDDWFSGAEMDVGISAFQGQIDLAEYKIGRVGAGGTAERLDIHDRSHATAVQATYSSCPRVEGGTQDWVLTGDQIDLDSTRNEGHAKGAVLHFLGVPILALPSMTFPTSSDRKSGWLPPLGDIDNYNGFQVAAPYYWNIAPNVDATLTPQAMTKTGFALGTELRYLGMHDLGQASVFVLPQDQVSGTTRWSTQWAHDGQFSEGGVVYSARVLRASDDEFWKDYPRELPSLMTRLLPVDVQASKLWDLPGSDDDLGVAFGTYARVQRWQTLQGGACSQSFVGPVVPGTCVIDPSTIITVPFQRSPQVGARTSLGWGMLHGDAEVEYNRFDLAGPQTNWGIDPNTNRTRSGGERVHAIAGLEADFTQPWGRLTPRLSFNSASYHTDEPMANGSRDAARTIPTFSLDSQLAFERQATLFGHDVLQTLEPRLLYLLTPYRDQHLLPMYDTAPKDFDAVSIYSDNEFTGVDRVSDANQITAGATTRYNDRVDGRELLRLGIAQRFMFHDQLITPENQPIVGVPYCPPTSQVNPGSTVDTCPNQPNTERVSDLLLWGSSTISPDWTLNGTLQFNPSAPSDQLTSRAVVSARWHPGPFQTLSATYRFARGSSEQYELGWQWPVYHRESGPANAASSCHGTLYAVGRVNYSTYDSRVTYAVGGLEYDAGCWTGSIIVEHQSTGPNEQRTHLMFQLSLVGLSSLGSSSLKVLKDNIPGYQPLRDDSTTAAPTSGVATPP